MSSLCLSLNLAFVFSSLSFAASPLSTKSSPPPKATPSDLLSLLGTPYQAASVNPRIAAELSSCFRFVVPLSPPPSHSLRRVLRGGESKSRRRENELVWRPPPPMAELARLAIDTGGDPDAIARALDPSIITVPDVEECKEHRCELTRTPYGSNVVYNEEMNLRNILWLAPIPGNATNVAPGVLVVLDARPDGIIYRDIIPDYVDYVRTIYEDDFGNVVADVNYLNVGMLKPDYQIFIC